MYLFLWLTKQKHFTSRRRDNFLLLTNKSRISSIHSRIVKAWREGGSRLSPFAFLRQSKHMYVQNAHLSHCATPVQVHVTFDSWDRVVTTAALLWISRKKQMDGFAMLKIHMNPFLCTSLWNKRLLFTADRKCRLHLHLLWNVFTVVLWGIWTFVEGNLSEKRQRRRIFVHESAEGQIWLKLHVKYLWNMLNFKQ